MKETKFKQTEVGMIPNDWEVKSLGEISNGFSYGVGAEAISFNGKDKYIRITDIDDTSNKFVPHPLSSPAFYSEKDIVQSDDILFARTGASVGKSYVYDKKDGRLIFAGFLMKLHIRDANSKFVFYQTLTNRYKSWIVSESMRTGQPGINLEQIKKYFLLLPQIEEQKRIAQALSDVDAVISTTEKLIAKKKALKQGTMQTLLSGKMRIQNGKWIKTTHFKQTELGPIPQEWELAQISSLFQKISIKSIVKDPENCGDFPVVQQGNIPVAGYSVGEPYMDYKKSILFGDHTLSLYKPQSPFFVASDGIKHLIVKTGNPDYHYYVSKFFMPISEGYKRHFSIFKKIFVPITNDFEEQTAIATVLSDMDSEIAALETKLAKYRQLKTGMMQQLLTGKVRLV